MLRVYSIYDKEREVYSNPFFTMGSLTFTEKEDIEALRIFKAQLFDKHNLIAMFPDKFDLCILGEFDDIHGKFISYENDPYPIVIVNGNDAVKEMRNEFEEN